MNTNIGAVETDPLATPAGAVDTSFPLLAEGQYNMEIAKAERTNNEDKGTESIKFTLKTIEDALDKDRQPLRKGFPVSTWWGFTPSETNSVDNIKKQGAVILQACGMGNESVATLRDKPEVVVGKIVPIIIKCNPAKGQYEASNSARFVPPKKSV